MVGDKCAAGERASERLKRLRQSRNKALLWMWNDRSKVRCYKEKKYCIGIWNVRPTNQGKLEAFKQEMARINIDILGISELKWTRMGEFNSDDHYIYYCGQISPKKKKME